MITGLWPVGTRGKTMGLEFNDYSRTYDDEEEEEEETVFNFRFQCYGIRDIRKRYLGKPVFVYLDDLSQIELGLLLLFIKKANGWKYAVTPFK